MLTPESEINPCILEYMCRRTYGRSTYFDRNERERIDSKDLVLLKFPKTSTTLTRYRLGFLEDSHLASANDRRNPRYRFRMHVLISIGG